MNSLNNWKLKLYLNKVDSERRTALMCAARGRHEAVVRLLLEKGADLEAKDSNGLTALQVASKKGHIAVMQLLTP